MINKFHGPAVGRMARVARLLVSGSLAVSYFISGSAAQAGPIVFTFDYSTNAAGVGFLDPVQGAARQAALTQAGILFSNLFGQYFTNSATLAMTVTSTEDSSSGTLASAGSALASSGSAGFTLVEVVRNKLQTGVDVNGATNDGSVDMNWGYGWELDPNVPAVDPKYDFYAAFFHEFTHTLGFADGFASADGAPYVGSATDGTAEWSKYNSFLVNKDGLPIIDPGTFILNQALYNQAVTGGACGNGMLFNGANAKAANGGAAVCLYSPNPLEPGSSISHLDTTAFPNSMMKPGRGTGSGEARTWNPVEVGMLTDLGYASVSSVPEPSFVAVVGGLGLALAFVRLRRRT